MSVIAPLAIFAYSLFVTAVYGAVAVLAPAVAVDVGVVFVVLLVVPAHVHRRRHGRWL